MPFDSAKYRKRQRRKRQSVAAKREKSHTPGSCHKRQKTQTPTPQALIRDRKTRKVANAKVHNRYTNLT